MAELTPQEIQTAERLIREMRRRGAKPSDLNARGQDLLARFQQYITSLGYKSYRDWEISPTRPVTVMPAIPLLTGDRPITVPRAVSWLIGEPAHRTLAEMVFAGGPTLLPGASGERAIQLATEEAIRRISSAIGRGGPKLPPLPTKPTKPTEAPVTIAKVTPRPTPQHALVEYGPPGQRAILRVPAEEALKAIKAPQKRTVLKEFGKETGIPVKLPVQEDIPGAPRFIRMLEPKMPAPNPAAEQALRVPPEPTRPALPPIVGGTKPGRVPLGQLRTPREILNRVFGGSIGDKVAEVENLQLRIFSPRNVAMRQLGLNRLTPEEDTNLFRVLEGRAHPISERVRRIAETFREYANEDALDYLARGARVRVAPRIKDPQTGAIIRPVTSRPFSPIKNYAPRMLDPRRVIRMDPQQLAQELIKRNRWLKPEDAMEVVQVLRADALGLPIPGSVRKEVISLVRGSAFVPTHLHARTSLVLPSSVIRPMKEAIPIYLRDSAHERAFLRVFGNKADEAVEQLIQNLGPRNPDVALAEEVWDRFRGMYIEPPTARAQKRLANILNNIATATLLGPQTAVSQFSQFGPLLARFGFRKVLGGIARVAFQGGRLEAERAGAFVNSLVDELVRISELPPTATWMDKIEQASARLARGVVKYSGIQTIDQFPRAVGFHAAKAALEDARRAAVLGNQRASRMLAEVGLKPTATDDEIIRKAVELSRTLNVTVNFHDLPLVLQTPIGAFARGLNTFNIRILGMVYKEFIEPAIRFAASGGKEGSVLPLLKFAGYSTVLGEAIAEVRRAMAGRRGERPGGTIEEFLSDVLEGRVPPKITALRAADAIAWSGTVGMLQNIWQATAFAMSPYEQGPRLVSALTGAGLSNIAEIISGALAAAKGAAKRAGGEDSGVAELRTSARILARRIPILGGIVGPRVFRSEKADWRVAVQTAARALLRGEPEKAEKALLTFRLRHGRGISQESIAKELQRIGGGR